MAAPKKRSGSLVESKTGFDPRIIAFHGIIAVLLLILAGGLAYQQIIRGAIHHEQERLQNERRIINPGSRGDIVDREGRLLVGNRPRNAVVLYLDELRPEFRREFRVIQANYRGTGDMPTNADLEQLAHVSVVKRYMDQVNQVLGRSGTVDAAGLKRHLAQRLLLPYVLVDDLKPEEFARLIEQLPVNSPLQLFKSSTRFYPYGDAAAHVLGYVGANEEENDDDEDFPGDGLTTLKMKGTVGRDGLEKQFDSTLQGEAGYTILRVDPAGYKVNPPIDYRVPVQGHRLVTSLDIDVQRAAEDAIGDETGAAVAMDVRTGEVLAMASRPGYDLNLFSPHLSKAAAADIEARRAWTNNALDGVYPPGSTFKLIVSTAALMGGTVTPEDEPADCEGSMMIGNRRFSCDNGLGHHGKLQLPAAIAESCDIYFWTVGLKTGVDAIAAEARRFHLDRPTGIELPGETHRMLIPDPAWKQHAREESWSPGDTANMSIGQGYLGVTPLEMACFAASLARDEVWTRPTLLHDPNRPTQRTERTGLSAAQRAAILKGMLGCTTTSGGTAYFPNIPNFWVSGVDIAGKTGTAQITRPQGKVDEAWFICFAPIENPEIAVAVAVDGPLGESFGGGLEAAPIASAILRKYFEKKRAGVAMMN